MPAAAGQALPVRSTLSKCKADWIGIKAHFYEPNAALSTDLYFFEGGYCGVQPVYPASNGLECELMPAQWCGPTLASTLPEILGMQPELSERSQKWQPAMEPVTTSPLVFHKPEPLQNGMLQAGDAAAFVDPFVGDGISLALRSGTLAAECLKPFFKRKCSLRKAATAYSHAYQERLGRVFKVSSLLRGWLRWPRAARKPMLSLISSSPFISRQIVRITR